MLSPFASTKESIYLGLQSFQQSTSVVVADTSRGTMVLVVGRAAGLVNGSLCACASGVSDFALLADSDEKAAVLPPGQDTGVCSQVL